MKKAAQHENKSLKTFYVYAVIVLALICISFAIKMVFIFQQSRVDPSHDFILAIVQQKSVKAIVAFHPETPGISVLLIQDNNLPLAMLAKKYGIATDGYVIEQDQSAMSSDMTTFLWLSLLHTATWRSNLTAFDKIRLLFLAKNVVTNNKTLESINLSQQAPDTNTVIASALTDQDLASENISIQIINATGVSGLGQRLGKLLTNMGANVVDVSSAQNTSQKTTIAYFGNESYTVDRLQKFLGLTATKLSKQTIADIVITIGNDNSNTIRF
jgi:hypothetical protein